jgi:uncharacterized protein (DUF488 family)
MRIATIGHGARTLENFLATLAAGEVAQVVDVRRFPGSRRHPQFGQERLAASLAEAGLAYAWLPTLGGRRPRGPGPSPNPAWQVEAFRNYADYMDTPAFTHGFEELLTLAGERSTAIMCAETHPSQCHRRLVADKLSTLGHDVVHLITPTRAEPHALPLFLRVDGERLRYDLPVDD